MIVKKQIRKEEDEGLCGFVPNLSAYVPCHFTV